MLRNGVSRTLLAVIVVIIVAAVALAGVVISLQHGAKTPASTTVGTVVQVIIPQGAANPPKNWNGSHIISDNYYTPSVIVVVIGVNNTVQWINHDSVAHTVTSINGLFDSGNIAAGGTFAYSFTVPGTYEYYCVYHPWMAGEVIVKQG